MSNSIPPDGPSNQFPSFPPDGNDPNAPSNIPGFPPTSSDSSQGSQLEAGEKFFPNMPMTKDEFKRFMQALLKSISTQMKQEQARMKKASEDLKKAEKGE